MTTISRISYTIQRNEVVPLPKDMSDPTLVSEWAIQTALYTQYYRWYDGKVYAENADRFPLAINPVRTACIMHRNALFGEIAETSETLARTEFVVNPDVDEDDFYESSPTTELSPKAIERRKRARRLSELVNRTWGGSNGRAIMQENGLISQILGGCAFAVRYTPWNTFSELPISIEIVYPHEFMPVYSPGDYWHLLEGYVVRHISPTNAKLYYGVEVGGARPSEYVEHWTRDKYRITVDGKVPLMKVEGGNPVPLEGDNPFGFVPFVYIPHEREGKRFYGVPVMHQLEGLLLEANSRATDVGDAVRDGAKRILWMRNVQGEPAMKKIDDKLYVVDLGKSPPNAKEPELNAVDAPALPAETQQFLDGLSNAIRTSEFTPGVAYGEDEGSQRSGLTLAFRMWPFSAHIRSERTNWSLGLSVIAEYIVRIAAIKGLLDEKLKKYGVTEEDYNLPKQVKWFPMLPRDEEAETNMLILRHQEGVLSTETAVRSSDVVDDPDEELIRLQREAEAAQQQALALSQSKASAAGSGGKGSSQGGKAKGAPSDTNPPIARNDTESY